MEITRAPETARAESRLPRWMVALSVAGAAAAAMGGHLRAGVAFALGAGLAILNYQWLHQAVVALMDAQKARPSARTVARFALRYPLALVGIYFFYKAGWLPIAALLAGLFVPVAGVLMESIFQISEGRRI